MPPPLLYHTTATQELLRSLRGGKQDAINSMVAGATAGAVVAGYYQVCVCENGWLGVSVGSHKSREMVF